jgi:hypothetical protein
MAQYRQFNTMSKQYRLQSYVIIDRIIRTLAEVARARLQVGQMLGDKTPLAQKQAALHILVDLVEHGGAGAHPLTSNVALACIQFSAHANSTVRRAACYGLAVCAQHGAAHVAPLVPQVLSCLHAAATRGRGGDADSADDDDFDAARDNAVDAVGRVFRYQAAGAPLDAAQLAQWAAWLPCPADDECNASAGDFLAGLLEGAPAAPDAARPALREAAARTAALPSTAAPLRVRLASAVAAA